VEQKEITTLHRIWPFVYATILLAVIGWLNFITADDGQYGRLTESFLAGKLELTAPPRGNWADTAPFDGYHYSALGPFPAVIFLPLVWAGLHNQGIVSFFGSLLVFFQCFRLAKKFQYDAVESCWFALAFCFGTSFAGVATIATSNHLAHVISVLLLFLAIHEYERKSRFPVIGGLIGLAMATRVPTGLNIVFFALAICFGANNFRNKTIRMAKLLLPFSALVGILAAYNFARFQNPFESGYGLQLNGFGIPYSTWNVPGNIAGPVLSLSYVPKHLWIFLAGLPSYRSIGTSVLLISPFLVYLLKVTTWDLTNKLIVINSLLVLLVDLSFRSTGFEQMGYRFSLDFFPFIFWLMIRSRLQLTARFKGLIFLATVIDMSLTFYHMATASLRRALDVIP
jgi:uncharacterized membrane protein